MLLFLDKFKDKTGHWQMKLSFAAMTYVLKILLFPFTLLYGSLIGIRHLLYDKGIFRRISFEVPVICVGNLSVGGSGKSPMVVWLLETLEERHPAVLSRGYGRRSSGFRWVQNWSSAEECGDEPLMIKRKFKELPVAVAENRSVAIPQILMSYPETGLIIMDDGMQHLSVKPALLILMTSWTRPFTRDSLLPAGRLREGRHRAAAADLIIVSNCPADTSREEKERLRAEIARYSEAPVFFADLDYGEIIRWKDGLPVDISAYASILAISGLADNSAFAKHAASLIPEAEILSYADHHRYRPSDIEVWTGKLKDKKAARAILTSEKDAQRMAPYLDLLSSQGIEVLVQPVRVQFHEEHASPRSFIEKKLAASGEGHSKNQ